MTRTIRGIVAATLLAGTSGAAMTQGLGWRVSEAAGPVTIRHGTTTRPAQRGATLEAGDAVQTGAGGRAVLVRAKDFVTVSANSRVTVPVAEQATGFVKIVQDLGNAIFKIEKLGVPHFGVNTPYLAAVVKGTTFSVTVDPTGTSLQVVEGAVEVATLDGGARDLVRPGDVASIGAGDLYRLRVQGDTERTVDSPARPPEPAGASGGSAAVETSTTPVIAVSSTAPVDTPAGGTEVNVIAQAIGEGISSKPVDLASATGGMILGTTGGAALIATVRAAESVPAAPTAPDAPVTVPEVAAPTTSVPAVAPPTVEAPATAAPVSVTPPNATPAIVLPATTAPVVVSPAVDVPTISSPIVVPPVTTSPAVTQPAVETPAVTAPNVTAPVVTIPVAMPPVATTPVVTPPMATTPAVTQPVVVTTPVVTPPVMTTPIVEPPIVEPPVVEPPVVAPPVVAPPVVTPPVVAPPVVAPPVVVPPVVPPPVVTPPVVAPPVVATPVVAPPVVAPPVVTPPAILPGIVGVVTDLLGRVGNRGNGNNGNGRDNGNSGRGNGNGNAFGRN